MYMRKNLLKKIERGELVLGMEVWCATPGDGTDGTGWFDFVHRI